MIPILFAASAALMPLNELPYAPDSLIYQTQEAVESSVAEFETAAKSALDSFIDLSKSGNFPEAYQQWSDLQFRFISLKLALDKTTDLSLKNEVKDSTPAQKTILEDRFKMQLSSHSGLLDAFVNNAQAAEKLTPQQRLFTENVLKDYLTIFPNESAKISAALQQLSQWEKKSFASAQGLALPIDSSTLSELKVFTANIICFPGILPYMYGGICPWEDRIDKMVEMIRSTEAEIVCLQEVWDPEAMRALIERLKTDYAHFIYDAGDPSGTLDVEKMGYNSGLFIASKLPLEAVAFDRFYRSIPKISNRGALSAACEAGKQRIAFITTHLQHGNTLEMREVRKEQLHRCYALLTKASPSSDWGFLAGDLNINALDPEYQKSGLSDLFAIPYAADRFRKKIEKATCTDYFNDLVLTPFDQRNQIVPNHEILDYCIAPRSFNSPGKPIQTLIRLFSIDAPTQALSDHNGLLTTWPLSSANSD
ncbi:MAG: endonuclease/exonuclease/phosphatase family protein [Verrucomicrobia bacterium]|nr:endonuclease/exonuclease/phosphatase family protein [Verrucomicrobiota bacterium]